MDIFLKKDAQKVIGHLGELNKTFSGKTILITGAAGFLGSHFVHYFINLNDSLQLKHTCKIIAWDNLIRDKPDWIEQLADRTDLIFENRNVVNDSCDRKIDFVIHAASIASPKFYRKYPLETMDTNVIGTRNVLECCKTNDVESLLFISTSEIYGDPTSENIPTPEEYWGHVNSIGPRACYDESKRYGETLCMNFLKIHGIPVKIARPFNVYGIGLNPGDGRVIPDFFKDAISKNRIELLSDGKATRTFCYVSDAIEGLLRVLLSNYNGEAFNIGTEVPEISISELAEKIKNICNNNGSIDFAKSDDPEYNVDNPSRRCPSIKKAKSLLGYQPKVTLTEGLEITYEYYNQLLKQV
jgi:UDP-glucuronate decarboxylase